MHSTQYTPSLNPTSFLGPFQYFQNLICSIQAIAITTAHFMQDANFLQPLDISLRRPIWDFQGGLALANIDDGALEEHVQGFQQASGCPQGAKTLLVTDMQLPQTLNTADGVQGLAANSPHEKD